MRPTGSGKAGSNSWGYPLTGASRSMASRWPRMESIIVVCLYVYSEGSTALVGQSHPFDRATGREILPPPPEAPAPARHRRPEQVPQRTVQATEGCDRNAPPLWIMHVHGVHCPTARAVAKAVDRWPTTHHFTVNVTRKRWTCAEEEVQGPEDPIDEVTCHRGAAVVVVGQAPND